nr:putative protein P6 [Mume associated luteovirus]
MNPGKQVALVKSGVYIGPLIGRNLGGLVIPAVLLLLSIRFQLKRKYKNSSVRVCFLLESQNPILWLHGLRAKYR